MCATRTRSNEPALRYQARTTRTCRLLLREPWGALLEKGRHPLARGRTLRRLGHHPGGQLVGVGLAERELVVERGLAEGLRRATAAGGAGEQVMDRPVQL